METLHSQADSFSAHEAIACVCESKEWRKSGEYKPLKKKKNFFDLSYHYIHSILSFYQGTKIIRTFLWYLNPRQVFDLTQGGPREG